VGRAPNANRHVKCRENRVTPREVRPEVLGPEESLTVKEFPTSSPNGDPHAGLSVRDLELDLASGLRSRVMLKSINTVDYVPVGQEPEFARWRVVSQSQVY